MPPSTADRLDRLERELAKVQRRYRRTWVGIGVLASAGLVVAWSGVGRPGLRPAQSTGIVRAQMFVLQDAEHNVRGTWSNNEAGGSTLTLLNDRAGDNAAVQLRVDSTDFPKVTLFDRQRTIRAALAVSGGNPW